MQVSFHTEFSIFISFLLEDFILIREKNFIDIPNYCYPP